MYKFTITYKAFDFNGNLIGRGTTNINAHTFEEAKKFLDEHLKNKMDKYGYFLSDSHSSEPIGAKQTIKDKQSDNTFDFLMDIFKMKK